MRAKTFLHDTAVVEPDARIGPGTRVWHHAHVRTGAIVGSDCVLGKNVFVRRRDRRLLMVGAGAVVTHDVHAHELVVGNPARRFGWLCAYGAILSRDVEQPDELFGSCISALNTALISGR